MTTKPTIRPKFPEGLRSMPQALAYCGIAHACRPNRALRSKDPIVMGIIVPQEHLETYAGTLRISLSETGFRLRSREAEIVTLDEIDPRRLKKQAGEVAAALRDYDRVFVLAGSREHLPASFTAAADVIVDVPPVAPRHVIGAAKALLGVDVPEQDAVFIATVPLPVVGAAMRRGRPLTVAMERMRAALAEADKEKARAADASAPTLDDLHGLGEAGDWGRELAIDLEDWAAGRIPWADVDRGILLSGSPGTGKTTFAAALARTCGVHFVAGSLARWQSMGHMGDLLKAMYGAFAEAKSNAPSVLFIDEIDAVGDRERFTDRDRQYCSEVVTGLLECIDGADGREGVVIVGACNHPDRLDAALTRPGRLDRHIVIPLPDAEGREGILRWHLQGALDSEDLSFVAERTEGWSGAALEQLVRQARRTARRERRAMRLGDLLEELPALVPVPAESLWRVAVHEAGHAVVGDTIGRWSIVAAEVVLAAPPSPEPSQKSGGVIFSEDEEMLSSAERYRDRIVRCFGGLAAEEVVFGERTDGGGGVAGSDLYNATIAAAAMEASLGLGGGLAYLSTLEAEDLLRVVQLDRVVRDRVERTLARCFDRAKEIVTERRDDVERLAAALRDRGRLTGQEVAEVLDAQPRLKRMPHP